MRWIKRPLSKAPDLLQSAFKFNERGRARDGSLTNE